MIMQFSLPFIDIIIFAVIAVFLIYRLKNILGQKTGFDPSDDESKNHKERIEASNVLDFEQTGSAKNLNQLDEDLKKIKNIDKDFSVEEFISGAKIFFEMVVKAFVSGDLNKIKDYIKTSLLEDFQSAVNERVKDNETLIINIKKVVNIIIKDVRINKNNVSIRVLFETDQIKVLKDKNNVIIDGNPKKVIKVKDIWLFERNIASQNKNWTLIETATE